jgi:hypothetical protein
VGSLFMLVYGPSQSMPEQGGPRETLTLRLDGRRSLGTAAHFTAVIPLECRRRDSRTTPLEQNQWHAVRNKCWP